MRAQAFPAVVTLRPRPVLLTKSGTPIYSGGFGSGFARHPTDSTRFYLLTDRGPNYEMPEEDHKTFPAPSYTPRIGLFHLQDSVLRLERTIELRGVSGNPLTGIPNPVGKGGTGEVPLDSLGEKLPYDVEGIDSEGLAAMVDGTFWVSDEYGPSLLHVDSSGRALERLSPFSPGRSLPAVLAKRAPNRGIEGLAVTPDQRQLAIILEAPLENPATPDAVAGITRLILLDIATGQSRQYPYVLDQAGVTNNGLAALTGERFLVLERDDRFPGDRIEPSTLKRVYRIDLAGATDISDPANRPTGRLFGGKTLEELTVAELTTYGIVPVTKHLIVDLLAPDLAYPHNKPEGVVVADRFTIAVANDDDFGIRDDGKGGIAAKILPLTGEPDETTLRFIPAPEALY